MTETPTIRTRTALVATDVPGRWAKQLASHLGRPGKMAVEETPQGPRLAMTFDGAHATCLLDTSGDGVLTLRAAADTEEGLERMTHVVGSHLERFGEKAGLQVSWA